MCSSVDNVTNIQHFSLNGLTSVTVNGFNKTRPFVTEKRELMSGRKSGFGSHFKQAARQQKAGDESEKKSHVGVFVPVLSVRSVQPCHSCA